MTYKVSLTKTDRDYLEENANGATSFRGVIENFPIGNRTIYCYSFKLRRDAISFAIWAGPWLTCSFRDATIHKACPEFSY